MKKISLILSLLFFAAIGYSQDLVPENTGYGYEQLTTAQLNALPKKKIGDMYYNRDLGYHVKWNGTMFESLASGISGISPADQAKLNNITINSPVNINTAFNLANTAIQSETDPTTTPANLKSKLESLTGENRLDAFAIKNIPDAISPTDQSKIDNISITQPVDLDDIESKANSALQSYTETDPTVNKAKIDGLGVDYESLSNKPSQTVVSQGGRVILLRTGGTQAQYDAMTTPAGIDDILEFPTDAGSGEIPTDAYVTGGNLSGSNLILQQNGISDVSISLAGLGSSADGSETKVQAGANTMVTGLGTIASPYIVSSTGTSGGTTTYSAGTGLTQSGTVFSLSNTVENRIASNDAKVGITSGQASAITANSAKVGITTSQANAIVTNTAKPTQAFNDNRYLNISGTAANSNLWNGRSLPASFADITSNYIANLNLNTVNKVGSSYFYRDSGINKPDSGDGYLFQMAQGDIEGSRGAQLAIARGTNQLYYRKDVGVWSKVWSDSNDGSDSGLDADLVRGQVPLFSIADNSITNAKIVSSTINLDRLSATGTRNATTVLHGDNTWKVPAGGGITQTIGTFAPVLTGSTGGSYGYSASGSYPIGTYIQTGDKVDWYIYLIITSISGTISGSLNIDLNITGLEPEIGQYPVQIGNLSFPSGSPDFITMSARHSVSASLDFISFNYKTTGSRDFGSAYPAPSSTGTTIIISGSYITN